MVPVFDRRKLRPLILVLAIALCVFQLTTCTGAWLLDPLIVRATHVGLVLSMLFLWRSSNRALRKNPRPEPVWSFLFDILMIAMSAGAAAYIITNFSYIQDRMPHIDELTAWDLFWGAGLIVAILEATRRVAGLALVIVSGIALLYAFFGHLLPGNMGHLYLAPNQIIESLYLLNDGIWGSSIGASATIIYVFILFGALLEKTNMASVFLELACLVTRNAKGGPAKAAIFGSALFGGLFGFRRLFGGSRLLFRLSGFACNLFFGLFAHLRIAFIFHILHFYILLRSAPAPRLPSEISLLLLCVKNSFLCVYDSVY